MKWRKNNGVKENNKLSCLKRREIRVKIFRWNSLLSILEVYASVIIDWVVGKMEGEWVMKNMVSEEVGGLWTISEKRKDLFHCI